MLANVRYHFTWHLVVSFRSLQPPKGPSLRPKGLVVQISKLYSRGGVISVLRKSFFPLVFAVETQRTVGSEENSYVNKGKPANPHEIVSKKNKQLHNMFNTTCLTPHLFELILSTRFICAKAPGRAGTLGTEALNATSTQIASGHGTSRLPVANRNTKKKRKGKIWKDSKMFRNYITRSKNMLVSVKPI